MTVGLTGPALPPPPPDGAHPGCERLAQHGSDGRFAQLLQGERLPPATAEDPAEPETSQPRNPQTKPAADPAPDASAILLSAIPGPAIVVPALPAEAPARPAPLFAAAPPAGGPTSRPPGPTPAGWQPGPATDPSPAVLSPLASPSTGTLPAALAAVGVPAAGDAPGPNGGPPPETAAEGPRPALAIAAPERALLALTAPAMPAPATAARVQAGWARQGETAEGPRSAAPLPAPGAGPAPRLAVAIASDATDAAPDGRSLAALAPGAQRTGPGRRDPGESPEPRPASAPTAAPALPPGPPGPQSSPDWSDRPTALWPPTSAAAGTRGPGAATAGTPGHTPGHTASHTATIGAGAGADGGAAAPAIAHILLRVGAADALDIRLTATSEEARSDLAGRTGELVGELQAIGAKVEAVRVETARTPLQEGSAGGGGQHPGSGQRGGSPGQEDARGSPGAGVETSPDRPKAPARADGGQANGGWGGEWGGEWGEGGWIDGGKVDRYA